MASGIVEYIVRLTDKTKAGTASAVKGSKQLEDQTEQTTRAVDKLGDESAQTSRQLDRMGKESRAASGGLGGLARGVSGAVSSVGGLTAGVGGLVGALGVGALVGTLTAATSAVVAFGQEIADLRNDITDASTRSGIAADTLQGLRLAAEGSGLAFSALTPGLDQFGRRLAQAADGGNATAEAFEALGVDVVDAAGNLRSADDVLRETLSALNGMESGGERTALALETLGRSGGRLLQALSGSELDDFVDVARDFGVNVGPDAAKSAGDWQRATAELSLVVDGLKASLFDAVGGAEVLQAVADELIFAFAALSGGASAAAASLGDAFRDAFAPLQTLSDALSDLIEGLEAIGRGDFAGGLDSLTNAAANLGQALMEAPAAIDTAAKGVAPAIADAITAGIQGAVEGVTGEGAQRVAQLRMGRARIRAGGAGGAVLPSDGSGGIGAGVDTPAATVAATQAAEAASRVFASGFAEDRARLSDVLAEGARNLAEQQAIIAAEAAATRAGRLEAAQTGIGVAGQVLSGDVGGAISSVAGARGMAGLGVAGAAFGALSGIGQFGIGEGPDGSNISVAKSIEKKLDGVKNGLIAAIEALPELIGNVLPRFAVSLIADLIPALIDAAPLILKAVIVDLPIAIAEAIAEVIGLSRARSRVQRRVQRSEFLQNVVAVGAIAAGGDPTGGAREELRDRGDRSQQFGARAARTASDGQGSSARSADRLAAMSTRPRRRGATVVAQNPYDQLAAQYDAQYGTYGRAQSTTIRPQS
jgi:hypothetical protein